MYFVEANVWQKYSQKNTTIMESNCSYMIIFKQIFTEYLSSFLPLPFHNSLKQT